jgi:hypothetical protein
MILKNLTSRVLNIVDYSGQLVKSIPPEPGINISMKMEAREHPRVNGIPVVEYEYTYFSGLPEPAPDTILVVKFAVLKALQGKRDDLVSPDTSPISAVKDGEFVVGIRQFQKI